MKGPPPRRPSPKIWDDRLRRAEALEPLRAEAAPILRFYRRLTEAQRDLSKHLDEHPTRDVRKLNVQVLLQRMEAEGPKVLAARAVEFRMMGSVGQGGLLEAAWNGKAGADADPVRAFLARALVAPMAVHWAINDPTLRRSGPPGHCPYCGDLPAVAVLREDKEAGALRRSLVCALCAMEWDFKRVGCPSCGVEEPAKLPRFAAIQLPCMRIEACEACKKYVKAVDFSKEPAAEAVVDELASPVLDVVARDRGWTKPVPNAAGF